MRAPGELTRHLHDDASRTLQVWRPRDPRLEALRNQYLEFLAEHPDAMQRDCIIGHLTASALVLDESRQRVLLTLHPKVGRWLQLGGHCEASDADLRAAAAREAWEEGGIAPLHISHEPVRLDRHPVPCSGAMSEHLDVQYLVVVPTGAQEIRSDESDDLRWFGVDELPEGTDQSVRALVRDALALGQ